jgi:molecular chaperone HtpG
MAAKPKEKGSLSIHTENIFPIIKKWLYSEHDIFLRELVSNAIDAMNKRKFAQPSFDLESLKIDIKLDNKKRTITVSDAGLGMTAEEVKKYINQIAFSGAEDFVEKYKDVQANIIGHFGLGFYSSFMVAEKVTIDTLSYQEGAEPAFWECDGTTDYSMKKGTRDTVGTTVTIYLNKESDDYLKPEKIREILEKYCNFMPYPIMFDEKQVNQKEALWNRLPKDVTEEEYREFYRSYFHDYEDPLFWIHLNIDFPNPLKGILYFPKIKNELDINRGEVKLFCNNVFVADNLKDLVPEFLLLLKGGIDIPDIPLNVSRSFLQNDKMVQQMSKYIVKKVSDHFNDTFTNDRKKFETYWDDISNFIKYGLLTNEDFFNALQSTIIFKSSNGDYTTLEEYKSRIKDPEKPQKIYYAPSEHTQVTYLQLLKEQGIEVIYATSPLDAHLFQSLEMKDHELRFVRVDSEINENLIDKEKKDLVDLNDETDSEKLREIFSLALNDEFKAAFSKERYAQLIEKYPVVAEALANQITVQEDMTYIHPYALPSAVRETIGKDAFKEIVDQAYPNVKVEIKHLRTDSIPGMIVFEEFMRRFQEMNNMLHKDGNDFLKTHTLVLNAENPTVKRIIDLKAKGNDDEVNLLCHFIHELALLEQKRFDGQELQGFLEDAHKILTLVK